MIVELCISFAAHECRPALPGEWGEGAALFARLEEVLVAGAAQRETEDAQLTHVDGQRVVRRRRLEDPLRRIALVLF